VAGLAAVHYRARGRVRRRRLVLPQSLSAGARRNAPRRTRAFARGGRTVDALPLDALVRPAACLDCRALVGDDPAYTLGASDVLEDEAEHGEIAAGCAVLVCTGWSRFRDDPERYLGTDPPAFPGIGPDAASLLVERGIAGIGIDTLGIDPGQAADSPAHRITMPAGVWHLEGLVGLEHVPPRGAWLVAAAIPVVAGSGAPARAFAILPEAVG
jgi:kynurenine formamidase